MPFNGSGTFTIPNQFVPNTTILSAAVNQNFSDIATGLSNVLTRDGQAGMTAVFKAVSGSVSAPGISFNSDATAGLYLSSTGIVGLVAKSLGLLVNSSIFQAASATVQAGGSGYAVGDTITETGGTAITNAVFTVATISGSAVSTVTVAYPGNYTVAPSNPVSQGSTSGSGTGCTLNITFAAQFASSIVTNEAGALPWQRLGASSFMSGLMASANALALARSTVTYGSGLTLSGATSPPTLTATVSPFLVQNYLSGLGLSTAGSSSSFSVGAGVANDSTNAVLMTLNSPYTKTTASWAVGSGNGSLDTGAIAINTWYNVFLIERVDTSVTDIIISASASPSLPANYTLFRRIGSMRTNASSQWTAFTQAGDTFIWQTSVADLSGANNAGARSAVTLTVPPVTPLQISALFRATGNATGAGSIGAIFTSLTESDQTTPQDLAMVANQAGAGDFERLVSSAAQIGFRTSSATGTVSILTYGWKDTRGK